MRNFFSVSIFAPGRIPDLDRQALLSRCICLERIFDRDVKGEQNSRGYQQSLLRKLSQRPPLLASAGAFGVANSRREATYYLGP
jgi:hypothetical protein